jgi:Domain of unknown function (DUF6265)
MTSPTARIVAIASLSLATSMAARAQDSQIGSLGWLAGCWAAEAGEAGSGEQWLPLAGGTMFGVGRTVKNGKTVAHEFMQIRTDPQGQVVFIAQPSGQREATFVASSIVQGSVVFENPQHDFPQRIRYSPMPGDRLAARIEGVRNGAQRGIDFPMKRVPCEALAGK